MKKNGKNSIKMRKCPTPIDGAQKLITQKISLEMCISRQKNNYHRCFKCAWRNKDIQIKQTGA